MSSQPSRLELESSSSGPPPPIPYSRIQTWKTQCHFPYTPSSPSPISCSLSSEFLASLPKLELHVHLEGVMNSGLRFNLAKKHGLLPIRSERLGRDFWDEESLEREVYGGLLGVRSVKGKGVSAFFEAYYGGMEVLRDEEDFYDLGMTYIRRAHASHIRYAEIMFDIQAHTRRGIAVWTVMNGLEKAKNEAERLYDIRSSYTANFLRDLPLSSAEEHYNLLFPKYRHLISGIGLDSNEFDNPPSKFQSLFIRARKDGLKLTCHCDVTQPETLSNITYVLNELGNDIQDENGTNKGKGADRVDHGLDAAALPTLVKAIAQAGTLMTLCPWAYVRHHTESNLLTYFQYLKEAGVKINISSDSPAYVEGNYLMENLTWLSIVGGWKEEDFVKMVRDSIQGCWANDKVKEGLEEEVKRFWDSWQKS